MKKEFGLLGLILALGAACIMYIPRDDPGYYGRGNPSDRSQRYGEVSLSYFYDYLEPYGNWISFYPHRYVWVPRYLGYRWRPYSNGHWIFSTYGWNWVSDYSWGWACFHYGRWGWDDGIGWYWVPGTTWAPAWVAWRWGGSYGGWAPLPPGAAFGGGYYGADIPFDRWVFIENRYFLEPRLYGYVLPFERNRTVVRYTELRRHASERGGRMYNEGPDVNEVSRIVRRTVSAVELRDATRPGPARVGAGGLSVYRPVVRDNEKEAPRVFRKKEEADRDLETAKIIDSRQIEPENDTAVIRRRIEEDRRLLERSQETEVRDVRRGFEEKAERVRDPQEKEKVRRDLDREMGEVRKRHEGEKRQLDERRKGDEEKVRTKVIKKKVEKETDAL